MAVNILDPVQVQKFRQQQIAKGRKPADVDTFLNSKIQEAQKLELLNKGIPFEKLPSEGNLGAVYRYTQTAGYTPTLTADEIANQEKKESAEALKQEALLNAERLKASDYGGITGGKALFSKEGLGAGIPEKLGLGQRKAKESKLYDSLVAALSLEKRSLLKGQGTITDAEFQVLQDAATTLSTDLSDEEFGIELEKTIDALSGQLEEKVLAKQGIYAGPEWDAMRIRMSQQMPVTPPNLGISDTQMQSTPPVLGEKKNTEPVVDQYQQNKYSSPKTGFKPIDVIAQFGANTALDMEEIAKGLVALPGYAKEQIKEKGLVGGVGELVKGTVGGVVDEYGNLMSNPAKATWERPFSTALDLLPFVQMAKASYASKAAKIAKTGTTGAEIAAKTPKTVKVAPFSKSYNPEIVAEATKRGIELPVSATTTSRTVRATEALVQKSMFGQKAAAQVDDATRTIGLAKDKLLATVDKADDVKTTGMAIKQGFTDFESGFNKQKTLLYENAKNPALKAATATTENLKGTLDDIITAKSSSLTPDPATAFYKALRTKLNGKVTIEDLKQTRQVIGNKLGNITDPIATGDKGSLSRVYAALSQDLDEVIKVYDPDTFKAITKANTYYKETINKINSKIGKTIANSDPEKLVDDLVKPNSETAIMQVKEIVGKEATTNLQKSFVEKLVKSSLDKEGRLDTVKLNANIARYGDSTIKTLLTPKQYQNLLMLQKESTVLSKIEQALKTGIKPAEGSQTAYLTRTGAYAGLALVNPMLLVQAILGEYGMAKLFQSALGKKILTTGTEFKVPSVKLPKIPKPSPQMLGPLPPVLSEMGK